MTLFADSLQIPLTNVFAVDVQFEANGNYVDFDRESALIDAQGKRTIVAKAYLHYCAGGRFATSRNC